MRQVEIQRIGTEAMAHLAGFGPLGNDLQRRENAHDRTRIHTGIRTAVPFAVKLLVGDLQFDIALLAAFLAGGIAHAVIGNFATGSTGARTRDKKQTGQTGKNKPHHALKIVIYFFSKGYSENKRLISGILDVDVSARRSKTAAFCGGREPALIRPGASDSFNVTPP